MMLVFTEHLRTTIFHGCIQPIFCFVSLNEFAKYRFRSLKTEIADTCKRSNEQKVKKGLTLQIETTKKRVRRECIFLRWWSNACAIRFSSFNVANDRCLTELAMAHNYLIINDIYPIVR